MAQNPGQHGNTIALNHLPAALEKAVELAQQNHITDRHLWVGFEILEADAAKANQLATTIAHAIGGPQAQPTVVEVGGPAPAVHAAAPISRPRIIGLKFTAKA